jgi:hypothetical protein
MRLLGASEAFNHLGFDDFLKSRRKPRGAIDPASADRGRSRKCCHYGFIVRAVMATSRFGRHRALLQGFERLIRVSDRGLRPGRIEVSTDRRDPAPVFNRRTRDGIRAVRLSEAAEVGDEVAIKC